MDEHLQDFKYERFIINVMPPRDEIGIVWHYTDAGGALGIIDSGTLRATSAAMLNDTAELFHGLDLIDEIWKGGNGSSPQDDIVGSGWPLPARTRELPSHGLVHRVRISNRDFLFAVSQIRELRVRTGILHAA
jgi:hypothetical protein